MTKKMVKKYQHDKSFSKANTVCICARITWQQNRLEIGGKMSLSLSFSNDLTSPGDETQARSQKAAKIHKKHTVSLVASHRDKKSEMSPSLSASNDNT